MLLIKYAGRMFIFLSMLVITFVLSSNVLADDETITFSVTVPSVLPVAIASDGNVKVASDARIVNNSSGSVKLDAVSVQPQNSWQLTEWNTDFSSVKAGSKQFAFPFNGVSVSADGAVAVDGFSNIASGSAGTFSYNAKIAAQTSNLNEKIANVVFTVSWVGHGPLASVSVTSPPNKTAYETGETFDSTGMVVTAAYADGAESVVTGWTISNGNSLTEGQSSVTVSYTEDSFTRTASVAITVTSAEPQPVYAILYSDGEMVFQQGNTPDASRTVTATYDNSFESLYVQPVSTAFWFFSCSRLTTINHLEKLNTSQVNSMEAMFRYCSFEELDVSCLDVSGVQSMRSMFDSCDDLVHVNVSGWNTANVTDMHLMFSDCENLAEIDCSTWNVSSVTDFGYMFDGCYKLQTCNMSGWNTSSATIMNDMFASCRSLNSLDLSGFNTSQVTSMTNMFKGDRMLTTIYASDLFVVNSGISTNQMFNSCNSLIGGNSTDYASTKQTGAYARIDRAESPGYFTDSAVLTGLSRTLESADAAREFREISSFETLQPEETPAEIIEIASDEEIMSAEILEEDAEN